MLVVVRRCSLLAVCCSLLLSDVAVVLVVCGCWLLCVVVCFSCLFHVVSWFIVVCVLCWLLAVVVRCW